MTETVEESEEHDAELTALQNAKDAINKRNERKASQESTQREYRSNLKKVRARVDCWNKSATRGDEATPNTNRQGQTIDHHVNGAQNT